MVRSDLGLLWWSYKAKADLAVVYVERSILRDSEASFSTSIDLGFPGRLKLAHRYDQLNLSLSK